MDHFSNHICFFCDGGVFTVHITQVGPSPWFSEEWFFTACVIYFPLLLFYAFMSICIIFPSRHTQRGMKAPCLCFVDGHEAHTIARFLSFPLSSQCSSLILARNLCRLERSSSSSPPVESLYATREQTVKTLQIMCSPSKTEICADQRSHQHHYL